MSLFLNESWNQRTQEASEAHVNANMIFSISGMLRFFNRGRSNWIALFLWMAASGAAQTAEADLTIASVNGGDIEYEVSGDGEPVLMIHGTGIADTFALTARDPALAGYRIIRMHRRGFAGSSRTPVPFSIKDHAADAAALLEALGIDKAHIVGHSFGASVTLQMAVDRPDLVHSLVIMDPPIFAPGSPPASFIRLIDDYQAGKGAEAMNEFSGMSYGDDWRTLALRVNPDGPEQVMNDTDTVFQTEAQGMIDWGFGADAAATIAQPVIYITGDNGYSTSLPQLQAWIAHIIDVAVIPDATHALLMQQPKTVAEAIAPFLQRHPL
jgi:pimeloyl-ACP methyl ester carboxylesterase